MNPGASSGRPSTFRRRHRLRLAREFTAVYAARLKSHEHPIVVHARVTDLSEPRLGLAIGRRVGNAVRRNAVKRRLREAFRLVRPQIPRSPGGGNYDLVVGARPHDPLKTGEYAVLLERALIAIHRRACRRERPSPDDEPPSP